ncbi:BTAD domain-containing putative transcriptional regulator [Kribbella sp. NPDC026611]|uniref:AfsR/SARP family transcriptional regulator n=1 Tax=Kribbella sp. NPDC026611 TaxID=3154911 RepID=UPI00340F8770
MEFRLLGTFEIWDGDREIRIGRRQERVILAALLLRANDVVGVDELVDLVWPEGTVEGRGAVQVYVSRLRKAGVRIDGTRDGYAVVVEPEAVDAFRFRRLVAEGRRTVDPVERSDRLRAALDLWRGPAVADVLPERYSASLAEERRTAEQERIDADLAAGRHEALADELAELVAADPLRERLVIAWMTALYRADRKAAALTAYDDLAQRLADEFGLDPAPAVRRLREAIVRDDQDLRGPSPADDPPRELPVDISVLVGRDDVLAEAVEVLKADRDRASVYCLWGAAGVGKSAAGTRIGHLVAEAFPDGQLFARMQDVRGTPVPARTLLGRMLRSLGVVPAAIPDSVEERARRFQEETAERSVLVVLDDVPDGDEVELLVPRGARCAAILTSRRPLATEAVHRQVLPLDRDTSRGLLNRLVGQSLGDQVDALVAGCAGLPLALRIVGARLAFSGADALPTMVGLDSMVAGDLAVRTSLDRTLALADPEARLVFERLPLVGVTEFPAWVAAPLLDCDEATGATTFGRLVELGLVELVGGQDYKMHDLVREYATELLTDPDAPRRRYLATVHRLAALADVELKHGMTLASHLEIPDEPVLPVAEGEVVEDAAVWFGRSWQLVTAAAYAALDAGETELAGILGLRLNGYHLIKELVEPRIELLEAIRDALEVTGPFELFVRTEIALAPAYHRSPAEDLVAGERLLDLANRAESPYLQVRALIELSNAARLSGDPELALVHGNQALAIVDRPGGPESTRSIVLRTLASAHTDQQDYVAAQVRFEQILQLSVPGSLMEGVDLAILGEIKLELEELDEAEALLRRAADNFRAVSSYYHLAWPTSLLARLAVRRDRLEDAAELIGDVNAWFEDPPRAVEVHLRAAEADLAIASGNYDAGRRILLDAIAKSEARGDGQIAAALRQVLESHSSRVSSSTTGC